MAARVEVVHGPDTGWRFTVFAGEVRIGRGAGHQIRLSDPAWGEGHLRLQFRNGGYLVTNLMPYPVFLDGQPLATGSRRTWYAGSGLQPTGETLLRLEVIELPPGPAPEGEVVAEPPGRAPAGPKSTRRRDLAALVLIALGIALVGYKQLTKPKPVTPAAQFTVGVAPRLAEAAALPGPDGRRAEAVRRTLQMAVFRESEGQLSEARDRYLEAKRTIADAQQAAGNRPHPVLATALDEAYAFVVQRLQP
jgi:hypothetical protein